MTERLTPEEARTVELSWNPIKRLGQLAEYGAAFHLQKVGSSPLPLYMTRGDLVRTAEAHEHARQMIEAIQEVEARTQGE